MLQVSRDPEYYRSAILAAPFVCVFADIPPHVDGLYGLVHNESGAVVYIGQTSCTLRTRWSSHKFKHLLNGTHRLHWVAEGGGGWRRLGSRKGRDSSIAPRVQLAMGAHFRMSVTSYLAVWHLRGDWTTRDALWSAACWEQSGLDGTRPKEQALAMADAIMEAARTCPYDLDCDHTGQSCYDHSLMWALGNAATPDWVTS